MEPPLVHNVPLQSILTVAEHVFVAGSLVKSATPTNVTRLNVLGVMFFYDDEHIEAIFQDEHRPPKSKRDLRYRTTEVTKKRIIRRLSTNSWRVTIEHGAVSESISAELAWGAGRAAYLSHAFEGDADAFVKHMLLAKMVGDERLSWLELEGAIFVA